MMLSDNGLTTKLVRSDMQIITSLPSTPLSGTTAVSIGNFDGCHNAHLLLLRNIVAHARRHQDCQSLVFTFEHEKSCQLLSSEQKLACFERLGIDICVQQKFDQQFAEISHQTFLQHYLQEGLRMSHLCVGDDFHFGQGRQGNVDYLKDRQGGFTLDVVHQQRYRGLRLSSSRIRQTLKDDGNLDDVTAMLGRRYRLDGIVVKGQQRGRQLGFPTANLSHYHNLLPRNGVYAGWAVLDNQHPDPLNDPRQALPAVINIGHRPTVVTDGTRTVEIHLLAEVGDLYGRCLTIFFHRRIRDERRFANVEELKAQINKDLGQTRQLLGKL